MKNFLLKSYRKIINSIAFYPTIMALVSIGFAMFMIYFEFTATSNNIKERVKVALVSNPENARLILGTIVGGIISLTVFSFSMVMVVLNRASANLSPRVIPGLVSRKFHQVVLGFYISTIIYSLMMIVNINDQEQDFRVPALGILVAMFSAVACLGLFVYFIHSISASIQVDNIIHSIFKKTLSKLKKVIHEESHENLQRLNDEMEYKITAATSGYFKDMDVKRLVVFLMKKDMKVRINVPRGFFTIEGYPYMSVNKKHLDKRERTHLRNKIQFYNEEYITDHYTYGFKQISEIAVKALSPGINDPGTAMKALDVLTLLFIERMKLPQPEYEKDRNGTVRVIYSELSFEKLLYITLAPIREYASNDTLVIVQLLVLIKDLMHADKSNKYDQILHAQVNSILEDAVRGNGNMLDKKAINNEIERLNKISNIRFEKI